MPIRPREFRVDQDAKIRLKRWPTCVEPYYRSKAHYEELLAEHVAELRKLQDKHYACNRYALLLLFQGMDAAGKDGVIKHVMSGLNPQGCHVVSFKQPSATELEHDFLWRAALALPERGRIGIFNRSYYEEVLIVRVHPDILGKEDLPEELVGHDGIWEDRYRSIRHFERHLHRNGTSVVKFFLHLSKGEQRKRFLARIDEPEKNWKLSLADSTANNGLHGRLIVGTPVPLPKDAERLLPLAEVQLFHNRELVDKGVGANVLGSPLAALAHLVGVLGKQPGAPALAAGEIVTTGVITDAHPVAPGELWRTRIGGLPLAGLTIEFA